MTHDVKVTPTEADIEAARIFWTSFDDGLHDWETMHPSTQGQIAEAFTRHRLQGWSECKEAAAKEARALDDSAAGEYVAQLIEALEPSTPESSHVE